MIEWKDMDDAPRDGSRFVAWVENSNYTGPLSMCRNRLHECWQSGDDGFEDSSLLGWIPMLDKPKKTHQCNMGDLRCYRDQTGGLFLSTFNMHGRHVIYGVDFCPKCGEGN